MSTKSLRIKYVCEWVVWKEKYQEQGWRRLLALVNETSQVSKPVNIVSRGEWISEPWVRLTHPSAGRQSALKRAELQLIPDDPNAQIRPQNHQSFYLFIIMFEHQFEDHHSSLSLTHSRRVRVLEFLAAFNHVIRLSCQNLVKSLLCQNPCHFNNVLRFDEPPRTRGMNNFGR